MNENAQILRLTFNYETVSCCVKDCGVDITLPVSLMNVLRENSSRWWYCINGHRQHFVESEVQRLQKRLEEKERQLTAARNNSEWYRKQRDTEQRRTAAVKGHLTRTKNRVGHGVCPCCNRTFQQLARHMKAQHPKYHDEPV